MALSDLAVLLEPDKEYQKNQTVLCTKMAYLLGVSWDHCMHYYRENEDLFQKLEMNTEARIMRALCSLRSTLMLSFCKIAHALRYDLKGLADIEWCKESIKVLSAEDIHIEKATCDVHLYIADVNKLISERINTIRDLFPEWLNWDYIKSLFLMPKGQNPNSIHKESLKYSKNRSLYPYQKYINWAPYDDGNILISDFKFVKVLYEINDDIFYDYSKVRDAKESDVKSIYDFINESDSVQLFVDCENSDVYKLASVLKQLDRTETGKIDKIVLYDGVYTTDAWRYLDLVVDIPIDYEATERVKEEKSLVDLKLAMGLSQAYYCDHVSSFILLSSDSDFWGVISSLPDAEFLVMAERSKCGPDLQKKLSDNQIFYCFIDDFCSANINSFKEEVIRIAFEDEMDRLLDANAKNVFDQIFHQLRMDASDVEKKNILSKLVKKLTLNVDKDANMRIRLSAQKTD